jgi:hypothetical protein
MSSLVECRTQEEMKLSSYQMSDGKTSTGRYSIATVLMNGGRITGSKIIPSVVLAGVMFGDIDQLLCRHHQLADRGWRLRLLLPSVPTVKHVVRARAQ